jgi:hypothetical protein
MNGEVQGFDGISRPQWSSPGDCSLLRTNCGRSAFAADVPELRQRNGTCRLKGADEANARKSSATIGDAETMLAVAHKSRARLPRDVLQDEGDR